jgi:putative sterol carrier protein
MVDLTQLPIDQVMKELPKYLKPEMIKGVNMVVQFNLKGEGAGDWVLTIKDGNPNVTPGKVDKPNFALSANVDDFKGILSGKVNPTQAFMMGKIKVTGDMNQAMKLIGMFKI